MLKEKTLQIGANPQFTKLPFLPFLFIFLLLFFSPFALHAQIIEAMWAYFLINYKLFRDVPDEPKPIFRASFSPFVTRQLYIPALTWHVRVYIWAIAPRNPFSNNIGGDWRICEV